MSRASQPPSNDFPSSSQTLPRNFFRGNSLPPQLKSEPMTPVPPPRSRRPSRCGSTTSLANSTQSLDVTGLADRLKSMKLPLKDHHPVHRSVDPPNRPPRKRDRIRKSMLMLDAIEEDQNKYDLPPREDETEVLRGVLDRQKSQEPKVPMPGIDPDPGALFVRSSY